MTQAENPTLEQRKAKLIAEADGLLDKQGGEDGLTEEEDTRYLQIEEALHNIQSMLKHVAADTDDDPSTETEKSPSDIWAAVIASAR